MDYFTDDSVLELAAIGAAMDSMNDEDACIQFEQLLDNYSPDLFTSKLRADAMRAVLEVLKTGEPTLSKVSTYMTEGSREEREEVLRAALSAYGLDSKNPSGLTGYFEALKTARDKRNGQYKRTTTKNGAIVPSRPIPRLIATSASDLIAEDIPPLKWLIQDMLPEGLSILAGKEKSGKSFLALQLSHAIACGNLFLGRQTLKGDVLYLDLESGKRRPRDRILSMFGAEKTPSNLYILTGCDEVQRLEEGLIEQLEDQLQQHPDLKLIIIDVLQIVKPTGKRGLNAYEADYETYMPLRKFISQHTGLAILVLTHLNKRDEITGSTANRGAMDAILQITREEGGNTGTLKIEGRDFSEHCQELAIEWMQLPPHWEYLGSAADIERKKQIDDYNQSTVVAAVKGLLKHQNMWTGTITEFISQSRYVGTQIHSDPASTGKELRRFAPMLRSDSIEISESRTTGARLIRLEKHSCHTVMPSSAS